MKIRYLSTYLLTDLISAVGVKLLADSQVHIEEITKSLEIKVKVDGMTINYP